MKKMISLAMAVLMLLSVSIAFAKTVTPDDEYKGLAGVVVNATVGDNCTVDETVIVDSAIDDDVNCGPRAYLRDSDAIYWLESKGGNMFLTVDSKRLGNNQLYQGTLSIDPASNRMQEEAELE